MANTVTMGSSVLTIVPDGATDFDIQDYFPNGIYLREIRFKASKSTDKLYVRDKKVAGPFLTPDGVQDVLYGGIPYSEGMTNKRRFPYMKAADCTFDTPANCLITIMFD